MTDDQVCAVIQWITTESWLGGRKGIRPVKTEWWRTGVVISLEQAYSPADAIATPSSLAPVKSRMVYLSGASLPRLS